MVIFNGGYVCEKYIPSDEELKEMKKSLRIELEKLI